MVDEHDTDGNTLSRSVANVYYKGGSTVDELVDRGKFLAYNRQMPKSFQDASTRPNTRSKYPQNSRRQGLFLVLIVALVAQSLIKKSLAEKCLRASGIR